MQFWFLIVLMLVERSTSYFSFRKLIGSNCILIERGIIPPYYDCLGCLIEEATGCVDDMRNNKSSNVWPTCKINSINEKYDKADCCPHFKQMAGKLNLDYLGSAYPEALRCVAKTGCASSTIYTQLMEECQAVCPGKDERDAGLSLCLSDFNSASSVKFSMTVALTSIALVTIFMSGLYS